MEARQRSEGEMRPMRMTPGRICAAFLLDALAKAEGQVPDGWYVFSSFRGGRPYSPGPGGTATYPSVGGLRLLHPRTPGPPVPITGLAPALVGSVGGIGAEGASCVVRRPSDGALLVGNISPAPASVVGLHILALNGT